MDENNFNDNQEEERPETYDVTGLFLGALGGIILAIFGITSILMGIIVGMFIGLVIGTMIKK